jgi:threonylcarbamoyladenosine tRNA methylthiotransferase MtaB
MGQGGFHTITLGCKLNQFDGAAVEAELLGRGLKRESDPAVASVVVINTCTVTSRADADARKLIRRVRRSNPGCRLLVTGCYAELDPEEIRETGEVDGVIGNRSRAELPAILDELGVGVPGAVASAGQGLPVVLDAGDRSVTGDRGCDWPSTLPQAVHFGERSRAFLKVQEGCDLMCSYCVIPQVRGPSRSVAPQDAETALRALVRGGYREVVLTGVNTGDYGRDLMPRTRLRELLERLLAACGATRLRLNSLEPRTVTDEIVELMATEPRLAPHLQVPLQSASDTVLRRMRRNYRSDLYAERLSKLRTRVPDAGLGADVIVGFPGETDAQFEDTYRFIERSPLSYLHVFSWSARPGTPAAEMSAAVPAGVIRERSARLRELGSRLSFRFRTGFEGRTLDAVVLGERSDGRVRALTGNFIELTLQNGAPVAGGVISARVIRVTREQTLARSVGVPVWAAQSGAGATMMP